MDALKTFLRFIATRETDDDRAAVRSYAFNNAETLAASMNVSPETFRESLMLVDDDNELIRQLRTTIERQRTKSRARRNAERINMAQSSASLLASVGKWIGEELHFDLISVLGACVTNPRDLLVFVGEEFEVAIPMRVLIGLDRLDRWDLRAYVDAEGLHVRWGDRGALNFASRPDPWAIRITFPLPVRSNIAA